MKCIYTKETLVSGDKRLKPSQEHIIPLALGGSNGFVTNDVCAEANAHAGNEIDDEVSSLLPYLMLRHRYQLRGNRKVIPKIKLTGEFLDLDAPASVDIDDEGNLAFNFSNEQQVSGQIFTLGATEERARFLLNGRLKSAKKQEAHLFTPYGEIKDEEDIEIALLCAERNEGKTFHGTIRLDMKEYHAAVARLYAKIALGLAHRVLGPDWTFGAGGDLYRSELFRKSSDATPYKIKGRIAESPPGNLAGIFQIRQGVHSFGIFPLPQSRSSIAVVALFGGECGVAIMDLAYDWSPEVERALSTNKALECFFEIPIDKDISKRRLITKSLQDLANEAMARNLL